MTSRCRFALLLLPFLFALLTPPASAEGEIIEDRTRGFRIELPDGWTQVSGQDGIVWQLNLVPPGGEGTTRLAVLVAPEATLGAPEAAREKSEAAVAADAQYSNVRRLTGAIAGREVPALRVDANVGGAELLVEQLYVAEHGNVFVLQSLAPVASFEKSAKDFAAVWSTFEFLALDDELQAKRSLEALAARCGSEVHWAATWEEAAARAREEARPILVHARFYSGFAISDEVKNGFFMDPTIIELVNARYVPFEIGPGVSVPFADHALYGLSGTTLGAAALIVDAEGHVVHEAHFPTLAFLRDSLAALSESELSMPEGLTRAEQATFFFHRGLDRRAARLLEDPRNAPEFLQRARMHARLLRGAEALSDLDAARKAEECASVRVAIDVEEANVRLGLREPERARTLLEGILERDGEDPLALEAAFRLGRLRHSLGDREGAEALWKPLIADHPESRWAWAAAATITATGYALDRPLELGWPGEGEAELMAPPTREPLEVKQARAAEEAALAYILDRQRGDGSWFSGVEYATRESDPAHDFQLAAAAICAQSLLPYRDRDGATDAVERALDWLLPAYETHRTTEMPASFMDYSVWSRAYVLWFLADCVDAGVRDAKTLRPVAERLIADLLAQQKPGGGWSYYLSRDLAQPSAPTQQAMSFTTAADVLALLRAREVGFEVPEEMLARSLDCLEGMRNDNGTYAYMRAPGSNDGSAGDGRPGAAGRGPVCALALYRGGRGSLDEIRAALEIYVEHRAGLSKEACKVLMHTGPGAQGSHYVLFDYATIGVAIAELPRKERIRYRDAVLEELLKTHCAGGGFQGSPVVGEASGTGLALIAFAALRGDG